MAASSDWMTTDFYDVLGVTPDASDAEIRRSYRKLARELHPDTNDDRAAAERFKQITAAHEVLGDPQRRQEYDEFRAASVSRRSGFGPTGGTRVRVNNIDGDFDVSDLGDLFGGLGDVFGGFGATSTNRAARSARTSRSRARRGADLSSRLSLPFLDSVHGTTTALDLAGDIDCASCHGTGADTTGTRCSTCGGSGRVHERRTVKVRIPAGVDDGQTIRLPRQGEPGRNGGPPGDLFVTVDVQPHPDFGRLGDHITITAPVTYPELVLGTDLVVPTIDAGTVTVRVPPGTPSGRTLRVPGRGVPGTRGDLLVTLDVTVPTNPTSTERELLEQLRALSSERPRARWEHLT